MHAHARHWTRWGLLAVVLLAVFITGCDPTIRATVENGVISSSTALFGSFLRAAIELWQESVTANSTAAMIVF